MILEMFGKLFFKYTKWEKKGDFPKHDKCIVIIAPHTSMSDFFIGKLFYASEKIKPKFIIKKEMFVFPFGYLLKAAGGIPIDRKKGVSVIDQMAEQFKNHDKFVLNITPEGTRKKTKNWKRGFYKIAEKTKVPLLVGYIDYEKKNIGIIKEFKPTGDVKRDMIEIKKLYKGVKGKNPENFTNDYE